MTKRAIPPAHNGHHILSPSSAHRWWYCPASIWLEEQVREDAVEMPPNAAALEGTAAHAEAEAVLRGILPNCVEYAPAQEYVDYVRETLTDPMIEVELVYHDFLPNSGGTADAVGVEDGTLHVIDLKYGMGKVEAQGNMQGKLYLLGAMETIGFMFDYSRMKFHIVQPRLGWVDVAEYSRDEILKFGKQCRAWYQNVLAANELIPQPGDSQCRWCDAAAVCRARHDHIIAIAQGEFERVA